MCGYLGLADEFVDFELGGEEFEKLGALGEGEGLGDGCHGVEGGWGSVVTERADGHCGGCGGFCD